MRGFIEALPGWGLWRWRIYYAVVVISIISVLGGGTKQIGHTVLGAVIFLAVVALVIQFAGRPRGGGGAATVMGTSLRGRDRNLSRREPSAVVIRMSGGALFPSATTTAVEDQLFGELPGALRTAQRRGRPIVVVPFSGTAAYQFGVEASVSITTGGVFEFHGLRRVRVTKTVQAPNGVFQGNYVPLADENAGKSAALVAQVKRDVARYADFRPDGLSLRRSVENETDVVRVANLVCQALFGQDPEQAALLLSSDDVDFRLRACATALDGIFAQAENGQGPRRTEFRVREPEELEKLDDVGGMQELKREIRETIGFLLENQDAASAIGVSVNGVLLYGPPGVGKTMIARATAGEYGLNFLSVSGGDVSAEGLVGVTEKKIQAAFTTAIDNAPCLLFFDEFDSMAGKRGESGGNEQYQKQVVATLLRGLEDIRRSPRVIVMAATNDIDSLDPALVRSGRFDSRIRVDLPDAEARLSIFEARLRGAPTGDDIDLRRLVDATEGRSGADIATLVESAKLRALRRTQMAGTAGRPAVEQDDLMEAIGARRGKDTPTLKPVSWDDLILPEETKDELRRLAAVIADPELDRFKGMKRPSGAVLFGPPGTGKTTVARAIATNTRGRVSFISVKGSDLMGKFVGDGERKLRDLFARARANSPAILFIDELDTILPRRGAGGPDSGSVTEGLVTEFLQQLDGLDSAPGVFVLGATNLPDKLDPAVVRGGRLGRMVELPLPTVENREALFRLHSRELELAWDVDFAALARMTERASGAEIESICQAAVENAYGRGTEPHAVTESDYFEVLRRRRTDAHVGEHSWDELILPRDTLDELKVLARLIADPEAGREIGLKPATGALLYGPPGTGKTTIAQVLASQLQGEVSFFAATGSDLVGKYVGESADRLRKLFERARSQPPSIIFIDELEALLPSRGMGTDSERESLVTEFLQQLDGLGSTPGVFVLGATNLPERLDPAALRAGRLGRRIAIPLPGMDERRALFALHSGRLRLDGEVAFDELAVESEGASGADIEGICNDAAERAFIRQDGPRAVTTADFEAAMQRWRATSEHTVPSAW